MLDRRSDRSFLETSRSDNEYPHIIPERQTVIECAHGVEFRVAVRAARRDGDLMIMQWCMRCLQVEILSLEAYEERRAIREACSCAGPGWWEYDTA
jgi:hypothetical protein